MKKLTILAIIIVALSLQSCHVCQSSKYRRQHNLTY